MYLTVYCCCAALPPKPDKPTITKNDTGVTIIIPHPPSPGNVTVAVECYIKHQIRGDTVWKLTAVSNCGSITIPDLKPGSCYSFILYAVYAGQQTGTDSDLVETCIEIRKFFDNVVRRSLYADIKSFR